MLWTDKQLARDGKNIITPFDSRHITNICYDLSTAFYCFDEKRTTACDLAPGACVFVQTKEEINLPNNMYAQIVLRNKRIRQGLALSAPVYQPGHHTKVFFRIMNVSTSIIKLTSEDDLISIMLYELSQNVEHPYAGAYQSEFDFRALGSYAPELESELSEIANKVNEVHNIERNIYGNVLAIMAIFVAVFTLINVNVSLVAKAVEMSTLLTLNLVTIGSIAALVAAIQTCLSSKKRRPVLWIVCIIAYIASVAVQFLPL